MEFSEETQIFLVAEYYRVLTEGFGSRGEVLSVASYFTYGSKKNDLFLCSGSFMEKAVSLPRRLDDISFTGVQRLL